MEFSLDYELEADGRWIAEISELPGVMAYGETKRQAGDKVKALALRVLADKIDSESSAGMDHITFFPTVPQWPSVKASHLRLALNNIGWAVKRQTGSHKTLARNGWPDYIFAFHDNEEIGPRMLARVSNVIKMTAGPRQAALSEA
jgi:predicted RNA binding protein YcfA (HicA-like mRNA interferase family)/predicted RNase H-like HicB family nuclease